MRRGIWERKNECLRHWTLKSEGGWINWMYNWWCHNINNHKNCSHSRLLSPFQLMIWTEKKTKRKEKIGNYMHKILLMRFLFLFSWIKILHIISKLREIYWLLVLMKLMQFDKQIVYYSIWFFIIVVVLLKKQKQTLFIGKLIINDA